MTIVLLTIVGTIVGTLGAVYLGFIIKQAWTKADIRTRFRGEVDAAKASERSTEVEQLSVLREQVLEVAGELGTVLPVSVRGSRPQVVTFSDGGVSYYYGDLQTYQRNQRGPGRTDLQRSFPGRYTKSPVSRWSRADLMAWLSENASS